jgi:hypothetical protein
MHLDPEFVPTKYKIQEDMLGKFVTNARQTPQIIKHKALYPTPPPRISLLLYSSFQKLIPNKLTE